MTGETEPSAFWQYDREAKGWHVYGMGQVDASGRQVVPNADVALYEFTSAMIDSGQNPGDEAGNGPPGLDPVDLSTGEFVMEKTDLVVADAIPLALTRTYRTGDDGARPFGIGTMHPYAMFLWSADQYQEADLILSNGQRIHYVRTSPGTVFLTAAFVHTSSPTRFFQSTLVWNGNGWDLTLTDGTVYVFGANAPLQANRDRFGNTVTVTWSNDGPPGRGYGRIVKVTSPNGRWLSFTYDGSDRITQVADHIDRTVGYEYDAAGRLWTALSPRGARAKRVATRARAGGAPRAPKKRSRMRAGGVTEYSLCCLREGPHPHSHALAGGPAGRFPPAARAGRRRFDIAHRMLTIEDPRDIVYLETEYDVNRRVERQTQADGGEFEAAYTLNGSGQVTRRMLKNAFCMGNGRTEMGKRKWETFETPGLSDFPFALPIRPAFFSGLVARRCADRSSEIGSRKEHGSAA